MKTKSLAMGIILTSLLSHNAFALTDAVRALVNYETKSNAVSTRSNKVMDIPHLEIPLDMLEIDFAERFSDEYRKHLIFEKDGKKFVRWILNPEDTKWGPEVIRHFEEKGLSLEKKYYFKGYQTASRSYIVEDPKQEIQISVKSSTDTTGGHWADKKQPVGEAIDSRLNADFLHSVQEKLAFEHIVLMDEPAIMKIPAIDQAVVFRDLSEISRSNSGKIYVPGFSVLHEETGRRIAMKNGSADPYQFWTRHYVKPMGQALGELAARTGIQFDSPHSQNFLVELDSNFKPTGRIVMRDLADLYIYRKYMNVINPAATKYFSNFSQKDNVLNYIAAGFGPLHGNEAPSWVGDAGYDKWKDVFFREFETTFEKASGLPVGSFKTQRGTRNFRYFGNKYNIPADTNSVHLEFWKNVKQFQSPRGILNCSQVMLFNL